MAGMTATWTMIEESYDVPVSQCCPGPTATVMDMFDATATATCPHAAGQHLEGKRQKSTRTITLLHLDTNFLPYSTMDLEEEQPPLCLIQAKGLPAEQ